MKKFISFIIIVCMTTGTLYADVRRLSKEQSLFQNEVITFLAKEKLRPRLDKDNDIHFTYNGDSYYIIMNPKMTDPYLLTVCLLIRYDDSYSKTDMTSCISVVARRPVVKLIPWDDLCEIRSEVLCQELRTFTQAFHSIMREMEAAALDIKSVVDAGLGGTDLTGMKDQLFSKAVGYYDKHDYAKSLIIFSLLVNGHYADAYPYYAEHYRYGYGTSINYDKMIKYYTMAIEAERFESAYELGRYYYDNENFQKAFQFISLCSEHANNNRSDAYEWLGYMSELGNGIMRSESKAIEYYRQALTCSHKLESYARKALLRLNQVAEDPALFVDLDKLETQDLTGQTLYNLGCDYENGTNSHFVNLPKAYGYFKAATKKKYTPAFIKMGEIYRSDYYPLKDTAQSDNYYLTARKLLAKQAGKDGQTSFLLAEMYQKGLGGEISIPQAKSYYLEAANLKYKPAAYPLALIYLEEEDYKNAIQYLTTAANDGNADAMNQLGWIYETGTGVKPNREKALNWYYKCMETDSPVAEKAKEALVRMGTDYDK